MSHASNVMELYLKVSDIFFLTWRVYHQTYVSYQQIFQMFLLMFILRKLEDGLILYVVIISANYIN